MRVLITGVTGFAGGHLAEALLARTDAEVVGTGRGEEWPADARHLANQIELCRCELCEGATVEALLRRMRPDQIYHLAGYANTGKSFQQPDVAWAGNLTATLCLYDAVQRWGGRPRILYVGSSLIYGDAEAPGHACDENAPLRPVSPYAASKAAADLASYQYTRSPGLDIVRARPFNHIGPRQSPQYAVAHFAKQIAAIERQERSPVLVTGDLHPLRDLTDVRDTVAAYVLLMEKGRTGEAYNVATGTAHSIEAVLTQLLAFAKVPIEVRQQADLVRAADLGAIEVNAAKLRRETGWTPRYSLDQTLADILTYWRQKV